MKHIKLSAALVCMALLAPCTAAHAAGLDTQKRPDRSELKHKLNAFLEESVLAAEVPAAHRALRAFGCKRIAVGHWVKDGFHFRLESENGRINSITVR